MKAIHSIARPCAAFVVSAVLMTATIAHAQTSKEGQYRHQACYIGSHHVLVLSKEQMSGSYFVRGAVVTEPGDVFHNTAGTCVGHWTLIGGEYTENGSCEFVDAAGDKFFGIITRRNQDNGNWRATGGTGRFQGIASTGQWLPATQIPQPAGELVQCNRQWGNWKLK